MGNVHATPPELDMQIKMGKHYFRDTPLVDTYGLRFSSAFSSTFRWSLRAPFASTWHDIDVALTLLHIRDNGNRSLFHALGLHSPARTHNTHYRWTVSNVKKDCKRRLSLVSCENLRAWFMTPWNRFRACDSVIHTNSHGEPAIREYAWHCNFLCFARWSHKRFPIPVYDYFNGLDGCAIGDEAYVVAALYSCDVRELWSRKRKILSLVNWFVHNKVSIALALGCTRETYMMVAVSNE